MERLSRSSTLICWVLAKRTNRRKNARKARYRRKTRECPMFFDIIEVSVWDLSEEKDPLKLKVAGFARHFSFILSCTFPWQRCALLRKGSWYSFSSLGKSLYGIAKCVQSATWGYCRIVRGVCNLHKPFFDTFCWLWFFLIYNKNTPGGYQEYLIF